MQSKSSSPTGHGPETTPLSRRRELLIGRLRRRRSRQRERLFLVEGTRCARQILDAGVVPRFAVCSPGLDRTDPGTALHRRLLRGDLVEVPDARLAALRTVADETEATPNQVILGWLTGQSIIPVTGASTSKQLEESIKGFDLTLTQAQMTTLNQAGAA